MTSNGTLALLQRRWLGTGLRFDPVEDLGRDLVLSRGTNGLRDFAWVSGVDNLAQSLAVAVTTPLGGDVFDTQFGFDGLNALADPSPAVVQRERVRVSMVTLLRRDPRVSRIVDVKLLDDRLVQPAGAASRQLDVRVVFEAVTGDRMTVAAAAIDPLALARSSDG